MNRRDRIATTKNEMPMPPSGAARPSLRVSNSEPASPPTFRPSITLPTEPNGLDQAPEGAEQSEEDQQAGRMTREMSRASSSRVAIESSRCRMVVCEIVIRPCARRRELPPSGPAMWGADPSRDRDRRCGNY